MVGWIQRAIKHPGAFKAKARAAGQSCSAYAAQVLRKGSRADARTKRQARLYRTLNRLSKRRRTRRAR